MQKLKQLSETGVWCVEVDKDANHIIVVNSRHSSSLNYYSNGFSFNELPKGKWQLLGTCDDKVIDFDVEDYFEFAYTEGTGIGRYYEISEGMSTKNVEDAFREIYLAANELFWVNKMRPPIKSMYGLDEPEFNTYEYPIECYRHDLELYDAIEFNKLTGKLAFLKQLK